MTKFEITHLCGHEEIIDIKGKIKQRENTAEYYASRKCTDCYIKEKNQQILNQIEQMNLAKLEGTEKQISWANSIRSEKINLLQNRIKEIENYIKLNLGLDSDEKAREFIKIKPSNKELLLSQLKRINESKETIENLRKETNAKKLIDTRLF